MITGSPSAKAPAAPPYLTFQCQKTPDDIYVGISPILRELSSISLLCLIAVRAQLEFRVKVQYWDQDGAEIPLMVGIMKPSTKSLLILSRLAGTELICTSLISRT